MAKNDSTKKAAPRRRAAAPRKGAPPPEPGAAPVTRERPSRQEIARRAYEIYQERGGRHGGDLDDWLEAERELSDGRPEHAG